MGRGIFSLREPAIALCSSNLLMDNSSEVVYVYVLLDESTPRTVTLLNNELFALSIVQTKKQC